jgi:hypothetical protein
MSDLVAVQTRLADLGYLDPPADGMWGGVSAWALGAAIGGAVQAESVTSPAVEQALAALQPLPLNPGSDLPGLAIRALQSRGNWIARHPKAVTFACIEGTNLDGTANDDARNEFKAIKLAIRIGDGGVPLLLGKWIVTTQPSRYWTENPMNELGAARVAPGSYKAWVMGEYHENAAWVQAGELAVQRDGLKTYKRYGPIYKGTDFGIHNHQDYGYPRNDEGRSSAGCWVTWQQNDHDQFIALSRQDARFRASNGYRFIGNLLLRSELPIVASAAPASPDAISRRCTNIWMTVFGGKDRSEGGRDPEDSAYTGQPIDPEKVGFSLPYHFLQPRPLVRAFYKDRSVVGPLVDVGPGGGGPSGTHDPYWLDPDGRPADETNGGNGAGLDATPAAWRALGLDPEIGKIRCDWELVKPPTMTLWRPQA